MIKRVSDVIEMTSEYPRYVPPKRRQTHGGTHIEEVFGVMLDDEIRKIRHEKTA